MADVLIGIIRNLNSIGKLILKVPEAGVI